MDLIATVLREHSQRHTSDHNGSDCTCDQWKYHWPDTVDHAAHQAAEVAKALAASLT